MTRDSRLGFTLIEAMVALVLAGAVVTAGFEVAGADLRASRRAARLQTAAVLAEDLLARAALAPAEQLAQWSRGVEGRFEAPMDRFTWRLTARPVANERGLADVRVEVFSAGATLRVDTRVSPAAVPAFPLPGADR